MLIILEERARTRMKVEGLERRSRKCRWSGLRDIVGGREQMSWKADVLDRKGMKNFELSRG